MADYPKYQFIPNGVFTITNCKNPKVYVNLIGGNASAALAGSENDTGSAKKWIIQNDPYNQIYIQSLAATGSYASVVGLADGVPVFASSAIQTKWLLSSAGGQNFYIRSLDGEYTWNLPSDVDDYTILLRPSQNNVGAEAQWVFTNVP